MGATDKINQDRGAVACPYAGDENSALWCVFDGHGEHGDGVAEYALAAVVADLESHPDAKDDPAAALRATFLSTDLSLARSPVESYYSGTTAVAVFRQGDVLYCANAGDSRAVLGRRGEQGASPRGRAVVALSRDHNPDEPAERARIEGAGGFVSDPPEEGLSARVWLDARQTQIGLAMGRSIGDNAVKRVGVIAEPEVTTHHMEAGDDLLVMGSDGIWEFITSEEAVALVGAYFDAAKPNAAKAACKALIDLAVKRWREIEGDYRDDITCIVMKLAPGQRPTA